WSVALSVMAAPAPRCPAYSRSVRTVSRLLLALVFIPFFFFNDPATTEIYTLSLHDALPIFTSAWVMAAISRSEPPSGSAPRKGRSEEHTSELQSRGHLVCRLLLEKKKTARIWLPQTRRGRGRRRSPRPTCRPRRCTSRLLPH